MNLRNSLGAWCISEWASAADTKNEQRYHSASINSVVVYAVIKPQRYATRRAGEVTARSRSDQIGMEDQFARFSGANSTCEL